ncbi:MAG: hypothetical protein GTN62_05220 [Gemmatimonadales bacterium]|nr:hypothetical protein [Gemmatimonadales bacterium]NIN10900.1 hypothetical protein [Gemmatimonadales bacterium]NIN49498.1 hypothetical protein [Gemmatimonadales bacterium]NIP06962.1 hypothetical protein [Gemmatimonadales bacterium]NIR00371.1 hypothetical protein [Gemmatimonadales bacterium]
MRKLGGCFVALLCTTALLVACSDQPTPTESAVIDPPLFNWMNNPDNGNPRIWRYQDHFAFGWTDPSTRVRAFHTTYPLADPDCSPLDFFEPMSFQDVADLDPDDFLRSRFRDLADADEIWILVRDLNEPGVCFGAKLLAQGVGKMHGTDNDFFAWYPNDRNNANAYGYVAQGKLTSPGGDKRHYNGVFRCHWDDDGVPEAKCKAKVNLK